MIMRKSELYAAVIKYFEREMPVVDTELDYGSTFQLLVAVVLSAQCTDARVNKVTPALFEAAPTPQAMAASMAAVLLVAGAEGKRSALTHSRVMIHQPLGGVQGQASDIEITAREIQKLKKELYTIISDHSKQPFDKVWADSDRDYWMTAAEAQEYGMIDRVLTRKI